MAPLATVSPYAFPKVRSFVAPYLTTATLDAATIGTTETVLLADSIAANLLVAGRVYLPMYVGYRVASLSAPTVRVRGRLGGVAGTVLWDSGVLTNTNSATAAMWQFNPVITVLTVGATGTARIGGFAQWLTGSAVYAPVAIGPGGSQVSVGTSAITIDTTAAADLVITVQFGANTAGNSMVITERYGFEVGA